MTFDEFINVITQEFVDSLDEEKAMAFIQGADVKTLLSALGKRGVTLKFVTAIQRELQGKAPKEQSAAAMARIAAAVSKPKGFN